jgi:hypothetical protein
VTAFFQLPDPSALDERQLLRANAARMAAGILFGAQHDDAAIVRVAQFILDEHDVAAAVAEAPEGLTTGDVLDEVLAACERHGLDRPSFFLDERRLDVYAAPYPAPAVAETILRDLGAEEIRPVSHGHTPDGALVSEIEPLGATVRIIVTPEPAPVEPEAPAWPLPPERLEAMVAAVAAVGEWQDELAAREQAEAAGGEA